MPLSDVTARLLTAPPAGFAGEPLPYSLRNDDAVTIALTFACFLLVWATAVSKGFIVNYAKNFFSPRERDNMFAEDDESHLHGGSMLLLLASLLIAILFFRYAQQTLPGTDLIPPYSLLGATMGTVLLYFGCKATLHIAVNSIFFDRWKSSLWREDSTMSLLVLTLGMLPLALLVVFFDLELNIVQPVFIGLLILSKSLVAYRCARIFFDSGRLGLHLFLYFCTLEITPLVFLWRVLLFVNHHLTTIYS